MDGNNVARVFVFFIFLEVVAHSTPIVRGPGHHKGLYGITKKTKPKTVDAKKNSTSNAILSPNSALKPLEKEKHKGNRVPGRIGKRSAVKNQSSGRQKSVLSRRTDVEVVGGVIKPVSLKEVKVGYTKSLEETDPKNSTQVIEIIGNMTSSKPLLERATDGGSAGVRSAEIESGKDPDRNTARTASSNMLTDINVPKLNEPSDKLNESGTGEAIGTEPSTNDTTGRQIDTRTPTSNIITDLKVPNMGQYIHGTPPGNNGSDGNVTSANQLPAGGNVTVAAGDSAMSRSPQVPNLGASIVGIVGTSNDSNLNNRGSLSEQTVDRDAKRITPEDESVKLEAFLSDLDKIANSTRETARLVHSTLQNIKNSELQRNQTLANITSSSASVQKDVSGNKKQEIIGPHYYEPECDDKKKCPDGHYCRMYVCVECHRSKHACTHREQCCNNMECVYGRCESKPKGSPGAFCEKDSECAGEACCVLEPTVDEGHSMCKPKLSEYHQCSPILYRKIWIGDNKPDCGPCKGGLQCVQRGVEGSHEVCMKKP